MKLSDLHYITVLDYFGFTLSSSSDKVLYYTLNKKKYLVYRNIQGVVLCYSVLETKNISIQELLVLECDVELSEDNFNSLMDKFYEQNSSPATESLISELKPNKTNKVLNLLVKLKPLGKELKQTYKNSFLINDLREHSQTHLRLPLSYVNDVREPKGNISKPNYDYLVFNEKEQYSYFGLDKAIFRKYLDGLSEDIKIFFDGPTLLNYSINNRFSTDIYLDLQPQLNFNYLIDQTVNYERVSFVYNSSNLISMNQLLSFIVAYISYKSDDIIVLTNNGNSTLFLTLHLRSTKLLPGSISLKVSKGAQLQKLKTQKNLKELNKDVDNNPDYNGLYVDLVAKSKINEHKFYIDINGHSEDNTQKKPILIHN